MRIHDNEGQGNQVLDPRLDALLRMPSITPLDGGCQDMIAESLACLGFSIRRMNYGDVSNLWAVKKGKHRGPSLCFAGHTDVVPPGNIKDWSYPPFEPMLHHGLLYARGCADMKGAIFSWLLATESFLLKYGDDFCGSMAWMITSDEEGPAIHGTKHMVDILEKEGVSLDFCIVGEPSSCISLGDVVRHGRRGSLNGQLVIEGIQGHIAYPELADNPIHYLGACLHELVHEIWDHGNEHFLPTSFQCSNLHSGTGVSNVIPAYLTLDFNFRFSPCSPYETLQQRVDQIVAKHLNQYKLNWKLSGSPFITEHGRLAQVTTQAIKKYMSYEPEYSTGGGTSDGRFIKNIARELLELGLVGQSIHQVDEHVQISDIRDLSLIYYDIIQSLLIS
jgi:succinyl-diaminopimelate desuccinylase